jgi:hypothetical protein
MWLPDGSVIITASNSNEPAYEMPDRVHGLLTKGLIEALEAHSQTNIRATEPRRGSSPRRGRAYSVYAVWFSLENVTNLLTTSAAKLSVQNVERLPPICHTTGYFQYRAALT